MGENDERKPASPRHRIWKRRPDAEPDKKVFAALHDICMEFDLQEPIWLDKNINEFKRVDKTRFAQDNFIESIDFDYLEIHVIEED